MADSIELRDVEDAGLDVFFTRQQDSDACRMAAFTSNDRGSANARGAEIDELVLTLTDERSRAPSMGALGE